MEFFRGILSQADNQMKYIAKDDHREAKVQIRECLINAWGKYVAKSKLQPVFSFTEDGKTVAINMSEILYFETVEKTHMVTVYTTNGTYSFWGSLKDIEESLTSDFFKCHKSYIVNLNHKSEIDWEKRKIILKNGEKCPLSFRRLGALHNVLKNRVIYRIK